MSMSGVQAKNESGTDRPEDKTRNEEQFVRIAQKWMTESVAHKCSMPMWWHDSDLTMLAFELWSNIKRESGT